MCNSSGSIVARYGYDPYGRAPTGQTTNLVSGTNLATFQYTGDYYHATSGLALTLYRAYDSNSGRWLSRDPVGERGGVNLFAYVYDNPENHFDPLGLRGAVPAPSPTTPPAPVPPQPEPEPPAPPSWWWNLLTSIPSRLVPIILIPLMIPGDTDTTLHHNPAPTSPTPATPTPTNIAPMPDPKWPLTIAPYATLTREQCEDKFDDCIMHTPWLPCLDALLHCRRTGRWPSEKCPGY